MNCTTTAPPSPASCLLAVAAGSRGKGISVPHGEEPLPQKRVVLSRTLRAAAPLSGYVRLSHFEKPGHTAYAFPPCSVRYRPTSKKGQSYWRSRYGRSAAA